ncbi:protein of unknown function (plasmid) [Shinella sp. WSC3-e]|nr:protein of unknown function [Shinella sp. WSC3-e]
MLAAVEAATDAFSGKTSPPCLGSIVDALKALIKGGKLPLSKYGLA